jgi:hypothetical protein
MAEFELDFLTFFQGLVTVHLNGREVHEDVVFVIVGPYEAVTFRIVEPFHDTSAHGSTPPGVSRLALEGRSF